MWGGHLSGERCVFLPYSTASEARRVVANDDECRAFTGGGAGSTGGPGGPVPVSVEEELGSDGEQRVAAAPPRRYNG